MCPASLQSDIRKQMGKEVELLLNLTFFRTLGQRGCGMICTPSISLSATLRRAGAAISIGQSLKENLVSEYHKLKNNTFSETVRRNLITKKFFNYTDSVVHEDFIALTA